MQELHFPPRIWRKGFSHDAAGNQPTGGCEFKAVVEGRQPIHAKPIQDSFAADGGTGTYQGEGYKITVIKLLQQDAMAAAVALNALRLHHDGRPEEVMQMLREVIAGYCRGLPESLSEIEAGFVARVEKLAESDPELEALLIED